MNHIETISDNKEISYSPSAIVNGERHSWDKRYTLGLPSLELADPFFVEMAARIPPAPGYATPKAIDLAAGLGRHSLYLAERGWDVTAVDISGVAMDRLKRRAIAGGSNILTIQSGLADFKIPRDTYDLVILFYYFNRDIFDAVVRSLRPGGHLIAKLAVSHRGPGHCDKNGMLPLQPGELPSYLTALNTEYFRERPVKDRGVAEYFGIKGMNDQVDTALPIRHPRCGDT